MASERFSPLKIYLYRGINQCSLQLLECLITFFVLLPDLYSLLGKGSQWSRDPRKFFNETAEKLHQNNEAPKLSERRGLRLITHDLETLGAGTDSIMAQLHSEEFSLSL